jgi:hypothetical protein
MLDVMHSAGINEFRSYLPEDIDADIRYPVFVRQAEQHTGSISPLIWNRQKLGAFLRWQKLRGYKLRELLVIEFCDTIDARGEYRKYSAHCVEGKVAAQYLHVDTDWMVKHHGSTYRNEWAKEEYEFVNENARAAEIASIFEIAKVDFGRIDYGLLDGKLQLWEINTNPSIGGPPLQSGTPSTPPEIKKLQIPARKIFFQRFHGMLESIDTSHDPENNIALNLREADLQEWREEEKVEQGLHQRRDLLRKISTWWPIERAIRIAKKRIG